MAESGQKVGKYNALIREWRIMDEIGALGFHFELKGEERSERSAQVMESASADIKMLRIFQHAKKDSHD